MSKRSEYARRGHPLNGAFEGMIQRCCNPKDRKYDLYGGRGITVCSRWRWSFKNFVDDMGEKPEGYSLDRIDTNGNYEPSNCRWASYVTQNNNRRFCVPKGMKSPKVRIEKLKGGSRYTAAVYLDETTDLGGLWDVSFKIDGIRILRNTDRLGCSRAGTVQLPHVQDTFPAHMEDAELFRVDWATSMGLKAGTVQPTAEDYYSLNPIDSRLHVGTGMHLNHEYVASLLEWAMSLGYEGLVLRQGKAWLKAVPLRFADVLVTGVVEGTGEAVGMLGSFSTKYGRVSCSSMTHEQKRWAWQHRKQLIGTIIQARYREKTSTGKLRFAVFERLRPDKDTEGLG